MNGGKHNLPKPHIMMFTLIGLLQWAQITMFYFPKSTPDKPNHAFNPNIEICYLDNVKCCMWRELCVGAEIVDYKSEKTCPVQPVNEI